MVVSIARARTMSTKFPPSPLLGYNNNVRHKGKVFHIQTEDSGVKYGHIITHLFMDGGRILKSVKTGYAEYVGNERMGDIVREMMKQQHKAMFIALRDGKFDAMVDGSADASQSTRALGGSSASLVPTPGAPHAPPAASLAPAPPAPMPPSITAPTASPPVAVPPIPSAAARATAPTAGPPPRTAGVYAPPVGQVPHTTQSFASLVPREVNVPAAGPFDDAPPTVRQPESELTLDIDALERAASGALATSPSMRQASELPPPPANLFRDRGATGGKYRMTPVPPSTAPGPMPAPAPAPAPARTSAPDRTPAAAARPAPTAPVVSPVSRKPAAPAPPAPPASATSERRYAPTRPAAIFGQAKPQPKSVFGEDLISDKSLDEVILSYLAEDLDERK